MQSRGRKPTVDAGTGERHDLDINGLPPGALMYRPWGSRHESSTAQNCVRLRAEGMSSWARYLATVRRLMWMPSFSSAPAI